MGHTDEEVHTALVTFFCIKDVYSSIYLRAFEAIHASLALKLTLAVRNAEDRDNSESASSLKVIKVSISVAQAQKCMTEKVI